METKPPDPAAVDAAIERYTQHRDVVAELCEKYDREPNELFDEWLFESPYWCAENRCVINYIRDADLELLADACEHYRQQLAAVRARAEWSEATVTHSLTAEVVDRIVKNHRRWAAYARILAKAHSGALKREYTEQAAEMERDAAALRAKVGEPDVAGAAHRLLSDEPTYTDDVFGRMAMRKDYRAVARAYLGIALPAAPAEGGG